MLTNKDPWEYHAHERHGAKIVYKMELNKAYIHQMYHEHFVEFKNMEELQEFKKFADANLDYWDYDPVHIIDTSNMEHVTRWHQFMINSNKIKVVAIVEE